VLRRDVGLADPTVASRRWSDLAHAGRPVRVSYGPGSVSFLVPPGPGPGMGCRLLRTDGEVASWLGQASRDGFRSAWGQRAGHCGVSVLGAFRSHRAGLRRWPASTACPRFQGAGLVAVRAWVGRPCVRSWKVRRVSPRSARRPASPMVLGVIAARLALMCPALCPGIGCAGDVAPWPGSRLMDPGPGSRASSRRVGGCSAMWNHRPTNFTFALIVGAAGILVQLS